MAKGIRRKEGDIVKIPLKDGSHGYGRLLESPYCAFYDVRTFNDVTVGEIIKKEILFIIAVMKYAISSGRWMVVANMPLESGLREIPNFFIQDNISHKLYIYKNESRTPATITDCMGLERAAVWDPEHVEDRLIDHFAGKPNIWVESLRLR